MWRNDRVTKWLVSVHTLLFLHTFKAGRQIQFVAVEKVQEIIEAVEGKVKEPYIS